jgi:hypothetical protein
MWSIVRLIMILSLLSDLHTKQVDYVQAYTQADQDAEIYMNIPRGFHVVDGKLKFNMDSPTDHEKAHCLKLKKNAYGLKQGGRLFWKKLRDGLIQRGFVQSQIDQCILLRGDYIIVTYVDDCLFFAKDPKTIEEVVASLRKEFVLTDEGYVGNFLGIKVERQKNESINLTQP